jgi:hypothetical protein
MRTAEGRGTGRILGEGRGPDAAQDGGRPDHSRAHSQSLEGSPTRDRLHTFFHGTSPVEPRASAPAVAVVMRRPS